MSGCNPAPSQKKIYISGSQTDHFLLYFKELNMPKDMIAGSQMKNVITTWSRIEKFGKC